MVETKVLLITRSSVVLSVAGLLCMLFGSPAVAQEFVFGLSEQEVDELREELARAYANETDPDSNVLEQALNLGLPKEANIVKQDVCVPATYTEQRVPVFSKLKITYKTVEVQETPASVCTVEATLTKSDDYSFEHANGQTTAEFPVRAVISATGEDLRGEKDFGTTFASGIIRVRLSEFNEVIVGSMAGSISAEAACDEENCENFGMVASPDPPGILVPREVGWNLEFSQVWDGPVALSLTNGVTLDATQDLLSGYVKSVANALPSNLKSTVRGNRIVLNTIGDGN